MKNLIVPTLSNRTFTVTGFDNGGSFTEKITLPELLSNGSHDTELLYTLQENVDEILDLKPGEAMVCRTTRDGGPNDKAILIRDKNEK